MTRQVPRSDGPRGARLHPAAGSDADPAVPPHRQHRRHGGRLGHGRGVETTRYTGRLDFRKALDAGIDELELSPAERQRAREGMQRMLDQLGTKGVPFEVFVDADGLLAG